MNWEWKKRRSKSCVRWTGKIFWKSADTCLLYTSNSAINALAEQYPTLYSYASMQHFQQYIFDADEHLQAARRLYNSNAALYNQRINTFPYLLLAKLHGMKEAKFYTVEEKDVYKRQVFCLFIFFHGVPKHAPFFPF